MSFTKIAALLAVAAASTQLVSAEVGQYEIVEFDAILADVKANLEQYMSLAMNNPDFTLPSGVLDVYQHMTTATDDSYTSYFTEMDFAQITTAMVQVPWYSSRLEPEIIAALRSAGISITSLGQSVSESGSESATASSDASSASESSSAASSSASESSSAASSSASEAAKSSSSAKASSAASSSAKASSSAEKSTNSSSSATSKNAGAAMDMGFFSAGVGAAIAGAAAMLL
ncbi:Tir3p [Saccharomyces cerevisiae YJM1336]|nr:Tir3p [Saccharomyces cerevisiae YJM1336]